jgi:hypothetical protein
MKKLIGLLALIVLVSAMNRTGTTSAPEPAPLSTRKKLSPT